MLTSWAERKSKRPNCSFSVENSKPTYKEDPEVPSCCHTSMKPLHCVLGESAFVFTAWCITAICIHYVINTGLSCPRSLRSCFLVLTESMRLACASPPCPPKALTLGALPSPSACLLWDLENAGLHSTAPTYLTSVFGITSH